MTGNRRKPKSFCIYLLLISMLFTSFGSIWASAIGDYFNGSESIYRTSLDDVESVLTATTYEEYKGDEVFAGKYHGAGTDYTAKIKEFEQKIIKTGAKELQGCVVVTKELAEILQQLMGKYTFEDVDNSWLKVCYYYDHLGPND